MTHGVHSNRIPSHWTGLAAVLVAAIVMAVAASPAQAGKGWRFKEAFGAVNQPTINPSRTDLVVDHASGDLLVADGGSHTVTRWNPDGTPSPFSALGTNVIDGAAGGPDATPDGRLFGDNQVAIDYAGTGNIYVTSSNSEVSGVVDAFSPAGAYLGRWNGCGSGLFEGASDIAVDDDGNLYFTTAFTRDPFGTPRPGYFGTYKFDPSANPPANSDCINSLLGSNNWGFVAAGDGPTDGHIFLTGNPIRKINSTSFRDEYQFAPNTFQVAVAVDPDTGHLFARKGQSEDNEKVVVEYDASSSIEATEVSRLFDAGSFVRAIAVTDSAQTLYVARGGVANIEVWEAGPTPTTVTGDPEEILGGRATVTGTVDPEGLTVSDCFFEYGQRTTYGQQRSCQHYFEGGIWKPLISPSDLGTGTDPVPVRGEITGLLANRVPHHYRLVAVGEFGRAPGGNETLTTAETYFTDPASGVTETAATLNGTVKLEGAALTECKFQWGLTAELGEEVSCTQAPGSIPIDDNEHPVSAPLSGLTSSTTYYYRLALRNAAGQILGEIRRFGTKGPPGIEAQMAVALGQSTATLQALVNPFGSQTDYHFEWSTDTTYGNRVPATGELDVGSGDQPVLVRTELSNLDPQTTYYFRVVAENSFDPTEGPDHAFQTLNEHGLPDNRAFELVTPADKGPGGTVVGGFGIQGIVTQAARDGSCFLWPLQNGMPESSAGGWARWLSCRDADEGWLHSQVSGPSMVSPPETDGLNFAHPSLVKSRSANLDCGVVESYNPLTPDTPRLNTQLGIYNLYAWQRSGDGEITYELITDRVPLNPKATPTLGYYPEIDVAEDCSRVYFNSIYELIRGSSGYYVWEEGPQGRTLYDARLLPDGSSGGTAAPSSGQQVGMGERNAVSPDGERFFFTATANEGPSSGKRAIFMRDASDLSVTEISRSQTAIANNGALYQAASADGRRVFFLANYGIADETSDGPTGENCAQWNSANDPPLEQKRCDLYAYDVETQELTDLSVDSNSADTGIGAQVQSAVGFSDSGSHAYFAALGQLIPGEGRTHAENVAAESANIYLTSDEGLSYVTNLRRGNRDLPKALMRNVDWTAEVSADGENLLFEAVARQSWYDGGGGRVAYRYSDETGEVSCVSCRPDGEPTLARPGELLIGQPLSRRMSEDGSRIFFASPDVLMPGAEAGKTNVYEWHEGQLYFLAISETGSDAGLLPQLKDLHDVSADGKVAFLSTGHRLAPQDRDALSDVYAVQVDGGFTPPPPPDICDPLSGGSCEGQGSSAPGAADVATPSFEGAPNPAPRWAKSCPRGKRKVTRNGKTRCVRKQVRKKGKRAANKTRRASR